VSAVIPEGEPLVRAAALDVCLGRRKARDAAEWLRDRLRQDARRKEAGDEFFGV
jgi:hypothetical protein